MNEPRKDSMRAVAAAKEVLDGRDPITDMGKVMVTLEHTVAAVLLMVMKQDPRKAAGMLNEGLVEGVEKRLGLYASKSQS